MKQTNNETMQKGVSLYLSFMIMAILMAIGLGINTIILSQMKMLRGMEYSVSAFYTADTGIEENLFYDNKVIPTGGDRGLCYMVNSCTFCNWTCSGCGIVDGTDCDYTTCADCTLIYESVLDGNKYRVEARVSGGVTTIKSVGEYKGIKRAIEVTR